VDLAQSSTPALLPAHQKAAAVVQGRKEKTKGNLSFINGS
jgi:hypothetical protein